MSYKKILLFALPLSVLFSITQAQTIKLSGRVMSNNEEASYTTVYFPHYNTSTLCNENGVFEVVINGSKFPITILLKRIGYETKEVVLHDNKFIELNINAKSFAIPEVTVSIDGNKSMVTNAFNAFKNNFNLYGFNYSVFYRKTQKDKDNKFLYSTEYVSDVYIKQGQTPGVENIKTRLITTNSKIEQKAIDEGNWEVVSQIVNDHYIGGIKKPRIAWLNKSDIEDYEFNYAGEIEHNNERYTKIEFNNLLSKADIKQNGYVFINNNDFGVLFVSLVRKFKNGKQTILKLEYQKIDNKYYLNYAHTVKENYDNTKNDIILMVTNVETIKVKELNSNVKATLKTSLQSIKTFESDSAYWGKYNYLPNVDFKTN